MDLTKESKALVVLKWSFVSKEHIRLNGSGTIFTADLVDYKGRHVLFRFYEFGKQFKELFE
jgi:hypothetical protein